MLVHSITVLINITHLSSKNSLIHSNLISKLQCEIQIHQNDAELRWLTNGFTESSLNDFGLAWVGLAQNFSSICPSLDGCIIVSQLIFLDTVIPPKKIWHSHSTLVPWLGKTYRSMKRRRIDTTTAMSAWPQNICHTTTYLHEMPNAMLKMSRSYLQSSPIASQSVQKPPHL